MSKPAESLYGDDRLPKHIAIIMDGNGRWASKRLMPRQVGHKAGIEALRRTIETMIDLGIPVLTVYAFSTENWKRPADEVNHLMNLLLEYLTNELTTLHEKNIKLQILGDQQALSARIRKELELACHTTAANTGLLLNIALNYGGRSEIVRATRAIAQKVKDGHMEIEDINETTFEEHLYSQGIPEPDLLIRTAGELRISNFLLWQIAYTEIWITDVLWPDFNREVILSAIEDYLRRNRKFGATK
ncbi:MAG: isoprenyl transferase [Syntrophomonadales bacterium]|jgi:undecaprenyl diphosphate synthase